MSFTEKRQNWIWVHLLASMEVLPPWGFLWLQHTDFKLTKQTATEFFLSFRYQYIPLPAQIFLQLYHQVLFTWLEICPVLF